MFLVVSSKTTSPYKESYDPPVPPHISLVALTIVWDESCSRKFLFDYSLWCTID
uniref:p5 protein n=1 Tax=Sweet potato chlorotic stunt virus TaxID=81931 RepID=A0A410YDI7_9CLOS|nr:p5 protein [Sweet potato chlorotic stunt virus]